MGYLEKKIQYVLLVLMVCLLLVLPAAAETLDTPGVSPTESIMSNTIAPTATPSEGMTVAPTEEPDESSVQTLALTTDPVILFNGTVMLTGSTFECSVGDKAYTVQNKTPLGALQAVAERKGFTYKASDKKWAEDNKVLLLDDIGEYPYVKGTARWNCYVNGDLKDGYGNKDNALNVLALADGDRVIFCYGADPTPEDASVLIKIIVGLEDSEEPPVEPTSWTIMLKGALTETVDQSYFEEGITHGHTATYTDENGGEWKGMPLWYLVGLVDDDLRHGSGAFNEALAEKGYSIKITAGDGYSINFEGASVAKNNNIIIANTLNGTPLPETIGEKNKPCWPLQLVGSDVNSGQKIGNIATIELTGLAEPSEGWEITLAGAFNRTVSQAEFEDWVKCHGKSYTDSKDRVWTGMPLWYLAGAVDDIETGSHWTFNRHSAGL